MFLVSRTADSMEKYTLICAKVSLQMSRSLLMYDWFLKLLVVSAQAGVLTVYSSTRQISG